MDFYDDTPTDSVMFMPASLSMNGNDFLSNILMPNIGTFPGKPNLPHPGLSFLLFNYAMFHMAFIYYFCFKYTKCRNFRFLYLDYLLTISNRKIFLTFSKSLIQEIKKISVWHTSKAIIKLLHKSFL